jgi:enoyl-CoA hydratase/carnithine racemase
LLDGLDRAVIAEAAGMARKMREMCNELRDDPDRARRPRRGALVLNRPEKHNAMSARMIVELREAAAELAADPRCAWWC